MSFVHLHLHSQFSLLDGANRLDDVLSAASDAGMPAMALTDHGNMFGAIDFYNRAKQHGVKPIIGIEAYVASGSRKERTRASARNNHLVLLARNATGYRNLIRLTSRSFLDGFYYKPRIDKELLREHAEGLIGLSACLKGEINETILSNKVEDAEVTPIYSPESDRFLWLGRGGENGLGGASSTTRAVSATAVGSTTGM